MGLEAVFRSDCLHTADCLHTTKLAVTECVT